MTMLADLQITIPPEENGQRLDSVLARLFPEYSRSQLTEWIKQGLITQKDKETKPKNRVIAGELVHLQVDGGRTSLSLKQDAPENIPLNIAFEDEYLLVINKPAGLVVHPGAGNPCHTLVNALLHHYPQLADLPRAGIIHRLDKDTTGLLLVAKTLISYTQLSRMMQSREIHRHYMALVYGHVIAGNRIETGFGRHPRDRIKKAVCTSGRIAITDYRVKKAYHDYTLLNVTLLTGRTHQIRVHLAHIHHPVLGDQLYGLARFRMPAGASDELQHALKSFKRQALHASQLSFTHPFTEEELVIDAALPDDLQTLLTQLDNHVSVS